MPSPIIDEQVFAELQASAGAEFVVELVDSFLEDAPQGLAALRAASATSDAAAFRRHAHSLKSNGATFGAMAFADAARALEQAPLAELGAAAPARVEALAAMFEAGATDLRERRNA
jgi:HPt (histidine-containing phosphotransfer) domain-containing protein